MSISEIPTEIAYSLDGQEKVSIAGNLTLKDLAYGEHNVTVYATDLAENLGVSETANFIIAEPQVFPVILLATVSIVTGAIVGAGLLINHRKKVRNYGKSRCNALFK